MSEKPSPNEFEDQATEQAAIEVDVYGVKAKVSPAEVKEVEPRTWKEVGQRVNALLKKIAVGLVQVVDRSIVGTSRLIEGLTSVPAALAKRIEGAKQKADKAEATIQKNVELKKIESPSSSDAVDALEAKLLELRARGIHVEIVEVEGRSLLIVTRPDLGELGHELGSHAFLLFDPETKGTEKEKGQPVIHDIVVNLKPFLPKVESPEDEI